jgi:HAE1 family hydrophobic/amphiphilic exporter-1
MKRPEIQYAITNFNPNFPQYQMDINVERAKDAGVEIATIFNTMQVLWWFVYHRL